MKTNGLKMIILAIMCVSLTGCEKTTVGIIGSADGPTKIIVAQNTGNTATFELIEQDKAHELMQTGGCIILDVRTQAEYDEYHIAGAVCLPNEEIGSTEPELLPDKEHIILVYCRTGRRSKEAASKLANLGYTNIKEFGGINTWQYEIEPVK